MLILLLFSAIDWFALFFKSLQPFETVFRIQRFAISQMLDLQTGHQIDFYALIDRSFCLAQCDRPILRNFFRQMDRSIEKFIFWYDFFDDSQLLGFLRTDAFCRINQSFRLPDADEPWQTLRSTCA